MAARTQHVFITVQFIAGTNLYKDYIQYVLDGQQRITSIFASLQGLFAYPEALHARLDELRTRIKAKVRRFNL
jgi:uncharacterized protein with ParB-like and HNH nuclease domain